MTQSDDSRLDLPMVGELDLPPPRLSNDRFLDWIADEIAWLRREGRLDELLRIPEPRGVPFSL